MNKIILLILGLLSTSLWAEHSGFYCQAINTNLSLIASSTKVIVMQPNQSRRTFSIDLSSQMHNNNLIMRLESETFQLVLNIEEQNLTTIAILQDNNQPKNISHHYNSLDHLYNETDDFISPPSIRATMFLDSEEIQLLCSVEDYLII